MENEVRTVKACMATCGRRGRWEGERWLNMELEPWPFAGRAQGSEDGVFCFFFFRRGGSGECRQSEKELFMSLCAS